MIRLLGLEDRVAFRALRQAALSENPEAYATSAEDWRNAPDEKIDALLQGSVEGKIPIYGMFAPDTAELVGLVGLRPETRPTTQHYAMLWGLYVAPESRCQGVGERLVVGAVEEARKLTQLRMLQLVVTTDNATAINLFKRAGFQEYGTEPRARCVGDTYYDQMFMYRMLS